MEKAQTKKKIKILFFSAVDLINGRGTENVLAEFIANAPMDKFEIYLMQSNALNVKRLDEQLINKIKANTKKIYKFNNIDIKFEFNKRNVFLFLLYELMMRPFILYYERTIKQRDILKIVKSESIDIIYLGFNEYLPFLRGLKTKIILSTHNLPGKFPSLSKVILKLYAVGLYYRGAMGIHYFPSQRKYLKSPVNLKNLCLPNGTRSKEFIPSNKRGRNLQILFVGSIEYNKGVNEFLSIFNRLKYEDIDFHIVGGGPLEKEVNEKSRNHSNLIYHGVVELKELERIYSESDLFLYPTKSDTYALVVLDALSAGLYVITSNILKGTYDDFENLQYLEYNSFKNLDYVVKRIKDLSLERDLINESKQKIHKYVSDNYDWGIISKKLYEYFESITYL